MASPLDMPRHRPEHPVVIRWRELAPGSHPSEEDCPHRPDKIRFYDEDEALDYEQWLLDHVPTHQPGEPYWCRYCGWWHRRTRRQAHESP